MYFRWGIVYIYPVIDKHTMILGIIFVLSAYVLSKTTPPPHCETWEEIQSKIDNQPK